LLDRENDAQWNVIHARAVHRWQIAHKLELLDELLNTGRWGDRHEFFLLASARMDLEDTEPRGRPSQKTGGSPSCKLTFANLNSSALRSN
jgi:hypothetical protein